MRYSISDYSRTAAGKGWGRGWPTCDAQKQVAKVAAPVSGVTVVVHKKIARLVYLLLAETERRGYLARAGQTWGGNCRAIAGTQTPSNHSWWLAVDLNSLANPYVLKKFGRPVTDMPDWLPLLWNSFGFAWGGDYSGARADAMHLEFMGSPADADDMTALAELRIAPNLNGAWVITDLLPRTPLEEDPLSALSDDAQRKLAAEVASAAQDAANARYGIVSLVKPAVDALLAIVQDEDAQTDRIEYMLGDEANGVRAQLARIEARDLAHAQLTAPGNTDMAAVERIIDAAIDRNMAGLKDQQIRAAEVRQAKVEVIAKLAEQLSVATAKLDTPPALPANS